ncbi:hypothetical protein [Rhizobium sullae]|nr:hypothetical protein [Rhizobium sullae]
MRSGSQWWCASSPGFGTNYARVLALKLKEICDIEAEGKAARELKRGPGR